MNPNKMQDACIKGKGLRNSRTRVHPLQPPAILELYDKQTIPIQKPVHHKSFYSEGEGHSGQKEAIKIIGGKHTSLNWREEALTFYALFMLFAARYIKKQIAKRERLAPFYRVEREK